MGGRLLVSPARPRNPTDDIGRAVKELERCARLGHRGVTVSVDHAPGESYSSAKYHKFWDAAAALNMPISLHIAGSEQATIFAGENFFANNTCGFTPAMYALVSIIDGGLFETQPKLKMISVENDASWALAVLERMDDRWASSGKRTGRKPSQVFHDQIACTFTSDRTAILNREIIGEKNIIWGSDYPHFDGGWPDQAGRLEHQFAGVPLADQIKIGRTNAIEFYNLPLKP